MAQHSLIFFDIDGTLLDSSGQVPPSARNAIRQSQVQGHFCFVNTGRPYSHLIPAVRDIPFDGYICSCGQHVLLDGQSIIHSCFAPTEARKIVALVRTCRLDVIFEGEHGVWFDHSHPHCPEILDSMSHFSALGFDIHRSIEDEDFYFDKFCVWVQPESNIALFLDKIRPVCTIIEREGNLLELVRRGYSKETGIRTVIEHTGIPLEHTYALGDSTNDLSMLRCVAHGIAMGNAPAEVQQAAEYVTSCAEENGVAEALAHYHLV